VGGIIWPIMLNQLWERTSFANGIRVTGAVAGFLLLLANVIIKSGPSMKSQMSQMTNPNFKAILCDVAYLVSVGAAFCISLGLFFPCEFLLNPVTICRSPYPLSDFYLQLYAIDRGINEELAFYVVNNSFDVCLAGTDDGSKVAILNAGSFFGRLLPNFIADRVGPYNMLIPCLSISSVLAFSIFGIHTFAGVAIFSFLYGFWSGSCR
jgi:MCP family monocarboxylic acid transporter-like MFS transporter 10